VAEEHSIKREVEEANEGTLQPEKPGSVEVDVDVETPDTEVDATTPASDDES
jgi:hypothetical protein